MTKNVASGSHPKRRMLSPRGKKAVAAVLVLHFVLAGFTHRDLTKRSAELIRGPKWLWRVLTAANTSFIVLYFAWGRRKAAQ